MKEKLNFKKNLQKDILLNSCNFCIFGNQKTGGKIPSEIYELKDEILQDLQEKALTQATQQTPNNPPLTLWQKIINFIKKIFCIKK